MVPTVYPALSPAALIPEIALAAGATAVLLAAQVRSPRVQRSLPGIALVAVLAAVGTLVTQGLRGGEIPTGGGLRCDALADFARGAALLAGVLVILTSWLESQPEHRGEFWSLLLLSLTGLSLVGAADDLLILFLALELVSLPAYAMVALSRPQPETQEAAMKYFFLGALATAMTGYGFSLLYGVAGSAALPALAASLPAGLNPSAGAAYHSLAMMGLLLSLAGLMFKIAAVPLHFYVADVYCGASSAVAGFLGFVPKSAGVVAIVKLAAAGDLGMTGPREAFYLLWLLAAASMTVGNVLALVQTNVKRMLAYSGVAHAGYMLVGVVVGLPAEGVGLVGDGAAAVLYYAVIYGTANVGAFGVLGLLRVGGRPAETLRDLAGLLRRHPLLALALALSLLTLMGLPPTAGFWGKLALFGSALAGPASGAAGTHQTWLIALAVVGLLNSVVAAAYYLRAIAAVLLYENDYPAEAAAHEYPHLGVALCALLLLLLAGRPGLLWEQGQRASAALARAVTDARAGMVLSKGPCPAGQSADRLVEGEVSGG